MLNIPIPQSVKFRPINTNRPNFDNVFAADTGSVPYAFTLSVPAQEVMFQVVTPDDNETYSYLHLIHNGTDTLITVDSTSFIGQLKFETYLVDFSLYAGQCCYFECYEGVLSDPQVLKYRSERFKVETQPDYLLIEWRNSVSGFQMDYSSGLIHVMQIEGTFDDYGTGGSSSVYSNQGEETKLKEIVQRVFTLNCQVPGYIADILINALAHDRFYINEIEYVSVKAANLTRLGRTDLYTLTAELTQKTIVGLNTHDVG